MKYKLDNLEVTDVEVDGIDMKDYPDFVDMYLEGADYDGVPMDGDQLDEVNHDTSMVYELYVKFEQ